MKTSIRQSQNQSVKVADLAEIAKALPEPEATQFPYELLTIHDNTVFLAGQIPKKDGKLAYVGTVGQEISVDQATRLLVCAPHRRSHG